MNRSHTSQSAIEQTGWQAAWSIHAVYWTALAAPQPANMAARHEQDQVPKVTIHDFRAERAVESADDHPPGQATIVLRVDDSERRWQVNLPDGISKASKRVTLALCE